MNAHEQADRLNFFTALEVLATKLSTESTGKVNMSLDTKGIRSSVIWNKTYKYASQRIDITLKSKLNTMTSVITCVASYSDVQRFYYNHSKNLKMHVTVGYETARNYVNLDTALEKIEGMLRGKIEQFEYQVDISLEKLEKLEKVKNMYPNYSVSKSGSKLHFSTKAGRGLIYVTYSRGNFKLNSASTHLTQDEMGMLLSMLENKLA